MNTKPVITVVEPDGTNDGTISLKVGVAFNAPAVTAKDTEDGDITSSIVKVGEDKVDTSKAAEYVLTYNVADSKGLAADECKVTVKGYIRCADCKQGSCNCKTLMKHCLCLKGLQ